MNTVDQLGRPIEEVAPRDPHQRPSAILYALLTPDVG